MGEYVFFDSPLEATQRRTVVTSAGRVFQIEATLSEKK